MKPTSEILERIEKCSSEHKDGVFTRLYRYLLREDIYYAAYQKLYANKGATTQGIDDDTADGFSDFYIKELIQSLKDGTYKATKRKSNHSDPSRYYGNNSPCALTNSQKFFIGISNKIFSLKECCDIIKYKTMLRTNGAAMNKYIGQQFAALRYEKNILVVEETTSAGGCGSFNAASSCPASACLYDSVAWGFFIV